MIRAVSKKNRESAVPFSPRWRNPEYVDQIFPTPEKVDAFDHELNEDDPFSKTSPFAKDDDEKDGCW